MEVQAMCHGHLRRGAQVLQVRVEMCRSSCKSGAGWHHFWKGGVGRAGYFRTVCGGAHLPGILMP